MRINRDERLVFICSDVITMDDRFASDLQIALYANLLPEYPSSDLSTASHSYASVNQRHKLSQGDDQCRQNIYVNVSPLYMNLPSPEVKTLRINPFGMLNLFFLDERAR